MIVWCGAIALFGLIIVIAGVGLKATNRLLYILFSLLNPTEALILTPQLHFSFVVLGAVTIGWSLTLFAAIEAATQLDKSYSRTIWILVTAAVISWFVIDSSLSIVTGFGLNAIANTVFIVTFLLPVLSTGVLASQKPDY